MKERVLVQTTIFSESGSDLKLKVKEPFKQSLWSTKSKIYKWSERKKLQANCASQSEILYPTLPKFNSITLVLLSSSYIIKCMFELNGCNQTLLHFHLCNKLNIISINISKIKDANQTNIRLGNLFIICIVFTCSHKGFITKKGIVPWSHACKLFCTKKMKKKKIFSYVSRFISHWSSLNVDKSQMCSSSMNV